MMGPVNMMASGPVGPTADDYPGKIVDMEQFCGRVHSMITACPDTVVRETM